MGRMSIVTQHSNKMVLTEKRLDRKRKLWVFIRKEGNSLRKEILDNQELHQHRAEVTKRFLETLRVWLCPDCRSTTLPHPNNSPCGFQRTAEVQ